MSEFTVEISRPGSFGALTSATLELPATWAEYQDAMEKARIADGFRREYIVNLSDCRRLCLRNKIPQPIHLLELNLLAQRLAGLSKQESEIFDAMVAIEAKPYSAAPIPLPRLINFTHSMDNCHVAHGVKNDTALGRWLFENDMLPEEVREFAIARVFWGSETEDERFRLIGSRHRQRENGTFCNAGYVEIESIHEVYVPGDTMYFDRSGAPVVLSVSKGFFNDPGYDNEIAVTLDLPAPQQTVDGVVEDLDAASWEECGWHCTECLIPAAKELIDDAEDIGIVIRFAQALSEMQRHTLPAHYKAVFEAVKPPDLEAATELVAQVDQYTLRSDLCGEEDYAREYLSRLQGGDDRIDLSALINPYALGAQVMKLENAEWTSYGVLKRKDGAPIQSQEQAPESGMEMR